MFKVETFIRMLSPQFFTYQPSKSCVVFGKPQSKTPLTDVRGVFLEQGADDDLLSHGRTTLPLAHWSFTSEFGKGSGGTSKLLSSAKGDRGMSCFRSKVSAISSEVIIVNYLQSHLGVVQSSQTSNQYWLATHITMLPHPTYQRRSLQRLFREI